MKKYKFRFLNDHQVLTNPKQLKRLLRKKNPTNENPVVVYQLCTWDSKPCNIEEYYIIDKNGEKGETTFAIKNDDFTHYEYYEDCFRGVKCICLTKEKALMVLGHFQEAFFNDSEWMIKYRANQEEGDLFDRMFDEYLMEEYFLKEKLDGDSFHDYKKEA